MQMKNLLSIIIVSVIFLVSCKTTKEINKAIKPKETLENIVDQNVADSIQKVNTIFNQFKTNNIDFKTFSAKIKVESNGAKGKNPDITAVVKIVKDSAIWISLSASIINVEVFRVFITKDSVVLVNKQEKEVQYRSLDYLQVVTEIPFDYKTLQDLIIGNPIFLGDSIQSYREVNDKILMSTINRVFKNLFTINVDSKIMVHSKMDDVDILRSRTADITYDDYELTNGIFFSKSRQISVSEKTKLDVNLIFKQYEFNKELTLSFNVPKNYIRK
jgi:2-polyprenyl-3-methyl-5-hydroxy-6-metoxy-1,4-benzoquinol methylase